MADKDLQHVQHIRGSEAASDAYTGLEGEVTINRTSQSVRVHDGVTEGGHGTVYHARVAEIPNENDIPKDWAVGCRVIAGPGTVAGAGVVPLPELTDERVVATFNGKKVYEVSFEFTTSSTINANTSVDISRFNANQIISFDVVGITTNGYFVENNHNGNQSTNSSRMQCRISGGVAVELEVFVFNDVYLTNMPCVATIRYTKTTD